MSAKDYEICPAFTSVYFAKVSKRNKYIMTSDRREITEEEILMLIDWYLNKTADMGEHGIAFDSCSRPGMRIIMKYTKETEPAQRKEQQ
jgi:hypothetical protein